jgi:hypothetical protein
MDDNNLKPLTTKLDSFLVRVPGASKAVLVPVKWDAKIGRWLLTPAAHHLIDRTKAELLRS